MLQHGQTYQNRRGDFIQIEARNGSFIDQYGRQYYETGEQVGHTHRSTGNINLDTAGATDGWRDESEYARTKWPDEFEWTLQREADEKQDEADLHGGEA